MSNIDFALRKLILCYPENAPLIKNESIGTSMVIILLVLIGLGNPSYSICQFLLTILI